MIVNIKKKSDVLVQRGILYVTKGTKESIEKKVQELYEAVAD